MCEPLLLPVQPFWGNVTQYPPVPVARDEIGPVWRQVGTGTSGTTTPQTSDYGIGQPSLLNVGGKAIMFFIRVYSASDAAEDVWQRPASDFLKAYAMQDYSSYYRRVGDRGNDVDYDVAFDTGQNRYVATIGKTIESPRVMYSETTGSDVTLPSGADPALPNPSCVDSAPTRSSPATSTVNPRRLCPIRKPSRTIRRSCETSTATSSAPRVTWEAPPMTGSTTRITEPPPPRAGRSCASRSAPLPYAEAKPRLLRDAGLSAFMPPWS